MGLMFTYEDLTELSRYTVFEIPRTSKHVAVLMNGSNIEGVFTNRYAYHAEELAIAYYLNNTHKMKRLRLYVGRMSPHNKMSRPCKHCSMMLKRFPNIRVFYTDEMGEWIEEHDYSTAHVSHRRSQLGICR
jgi:cytidine deaminase